MQICWKCPATDEDYVTQRAWEGAILSKCPFHPEGGCGLERLGSYSRVEPEGARIPRWWCPQKRQSISLLPSFLAARFQGTLDAVERVVMAVEAGGLAAAVDVVHPPDAEVAIGVAGALRSMRRRVQAVRATLLAIATLLPEGFTGVEPSLAAFREVLGGDLVLGRLREIAERHLASLPAPFGFRTRVDT
jgi:hypothetical protein